jgi:hypothetical protein
MICDLKWDYRGRPNGRHKFKTSRVLFTRECMCGSIAPLQKAMRLNEEERYMTIKMKLKVMR